MRISPKLTELGNDISLNPELFARVKAVYENKKLKLDAEDRKLLDDTYKSFARSGAALSEADKELYRQYTTELSQLTLQFSQNSLDATNAFTLQHYRPGTGRGASRFRQGGAWPPRPRLAASRAGR